MPSRNSSHDNQNAKPNLVDCFFFSLNTPSTANTRLKYMHQQIEFLKTEEKIEECGIGNIDMELRLTNGETSTICVLLMFFLAKNSPAQILLLGLDVRVKDNTKVWVRF